MSTMPLVVPTTKELPGFTRREREHVAHLRRRQQFLQERIEGSDVDLTWDKNELKAITWALDELTNAEIIEEHNCAPGKCCSVCDRHVEPHKGCVMR